MASAPLLNLESLSANPTVSIDGTEYVLLQSEALPVLDYLKTLRLRQDFAEATGPVADGKAHTPEQSKDVARILKEMVGIVLVAPLFVRDSLTEYQRLIIFQTFMEQRTASGSLKTKKDKPEAPPTKGKQSSKKRPTGVH